MWPCIFYFFQHTASRYIDTLVRSYFLQLFLRFWYFSILIKAFSVRKDYICISHYRDKCRSCNCYIPTSSRFSTFTASCKYCFFATTIIPQARYGFLIIIIGRIQLVKACTNNIWQKFFRQAILRLIHINISKKNASHIFWNEEKVISIITEWFILLFFKVTYRLFQIAFKVGKYVFLWCSAYIKGCVHIRHKVDIRNITPHYYHIIVLHSTEYVKVLLIYSKLFGFLLFKHHNSSIGFIKIAPNAIDRATTRINVLAN